MKSGTLDGFVVLAAMGVFLYIALAQTVFAFRHPWATDTERFLYVGRALTFGSVDYAEARPRETKDKE